MRRRSSARTRWRTTRTSTRSSSPPTPDRVTLIANFIPFEAAYGGPNFFKFDDNVLYEIMVDNDGDAVEDVTFQFRFRTDVATTNTFLYNTGPITSLDVAELQRPAVLHGDAGRRPATPRARHVLAADLPTPPVNVGLRSTPNYAALAASPCGSFHSSRSSPASATTRSSST